jgi:hypothetical protein
VNSDSKYRIRRDTAIKDDKIMPKTKQTNSGEVVVDLKELEWVKILEITVPSDLVWLARIKMLHPVQFNRVDLTLLINCVRANAAAVTRSRERCVLERIADKLEKAMRLPPPRPTRHLAASKHVRNDKQTALKAMQQDLRNLRKTTPADDPVLTQLQDAVNALTKSLKGRREKSFPDIIGEK